MGRGVVVCVCVSFPCVSRRCVVGILVFTARWGRGVGCRAAGEGTFAMVAGPALESGVHTLVLRLAKGNRTAFGVGTKTHEPSASNISRGMWTQWAHGAGSWDDGELVAGAPFAEAREGAEVSRIFHACALFVARLLVSAWL